MAWTVSPRHSRNHPNRILQESPLEHSSIPVGIAIVAFVIWATWFYAIFRGFTRKQTPGRAYWIWISGLAVVVVGITVFVMHHYRM